MSEKNNIPLNNIHPIDWSESYLGNGPLPATATHGDPVDDEALLGLVAEPAGLVGPGGARSTMYLDSSVRSGQNISDERYLGHNGNL